MIFMLSRMESVHTRMRSFTELPPLFHRPSLHWNTPCESPFYAPSINRNIRINIPRASFHVTLHPATMDDPSDPPSTAKTFRYERGWRVVSREVSKREGRKRVGWRNWPRDKTRESFNNGDLLLRERSFPFFLLLLFFFSSAKRSTKLAKTGCAARANISSRLTLRRGKSASVFLTRSVPSIPRSQHAGFRTFLREGGLYLKKKSRSRRRINSWGVWKMFLRSSSRHFFLFLVFFPLVTCAIVYNYHYYRANISLILQLRRIIFARKNDDDLYLDFDALV